jgi:hypothetical protein
LFRYSVAKYMKLYYLPKIFFYVAVPPPNICTCCGLSCFQYKTRRVSSMSNSNLYCKAES